MSDFDTGDRRFDGCGQVDDLVQQLMRVKRQHELADSDVERVDERGRSPRTGLVEKR